MLFYQKKNPCTTDSSRPAKQNLHSAHIPTHPHTHTHEHTQNSTSKDLPHCIYLWEVIGQS